MTSSEALRLARSIVDTLEEKKGEDILLLDLDGICDFTDYFVICSGTSERGLRSLANEVSRRLKETHKKKEGAIEGDAGSGWVLLDYGDVVVHLFSPGTRAYYRLEELWQDGKVLLHVS